MDGTLLTSEKVIADTTRRKLIDMQNKGIKVILASGRPDKGMKPFARELELGKHDSVYISFNGSRVTNAKTEEVVFNQALDIKLTQEILKHLKQYDVIPILIDPTDTYLVVEDVYNMMVNWNGNPTNIIQYEARAIDYLLCEQRDLVAYANYPLNKVLVAGSSDYLKKFHDEMANPFKDRTNAMFTADVYFEFVDKNVDKSHALAEVLKQMNLKMDEVMAFGDSQNDLGMIKAAKIGVAMGNANEIVKDAADYITKTNDDDGIVLAIEHFADQFA